MMIYKSKVTIMDFISTKFFFMNRADSAVGCGELACCRQGHCRGRRKCDREICMEVLKVVYLKRMLTLKLEGQSTPPRPAY